MLKLSEFIFYNINYCHIQSLEIKETKVQLCLSNLNCDYCGQLTISGSLGSAWFRRRIRHWFIRFKRNKLNQFMLPLTSAQLVRTQDTYFVIMVHFNPLASYWSCAILASILIAITQPELRRVLTTECKRFHETSLCMLTACVLISEKPTWLIPFLARKVSVFSETEGNLPRFRAWPGFRKIKRRQTAQNDSDGKKSIFFNNRASLAILA